MALGDRTTQAKAGTARIRIIARGQIITGRRPTRSASQPPSSGKITEARPSAIGTAVAVTVLSTRASTLARDGASADAAFVGGLQTSFAVATGIALVVVALAFVLPARLPVTAIAEAVRERVSGLLDAVDDDERVTRRHMVAALFDADRPPAEDD